MAVAIVPWMQTVCNLLAHRLGKKYPVWEEKLTGGQSDVCRDTLPLCYHASALRHWSLLCTGGENRFPVQDAGCGTLKSFIYNP